MIPFTQVQTAIYDALTPALAPAPVVDQAGPNQVFPYATIGEFVAGHNDTLGERAIDLDVTVHLWSREQGMQECQLLMKKAINALDRKALPATGFQWVTTIWQFGQTLRESDGVTRHGILRFQVMTFEPPAAPIPPATELSGTVSTSGNLSVLWKTGDKFIPEVEGKMITIGAASYTITDYLSEIQVYVTPHPPYAASAAYTITF